MFYHADTNQYFSNKRQAQNTLKVLSPELQEVSVTAEPSPVYDPLKQRAIRTETFSGATKTISYTLEDIPPAEVDAAVQGKANELFEGSDEDKAIGYTIADLWLFMQTGKTPNQATQAEINAARQQVKSRVLANLREIKGLT